MALKMDWMSTFCGVSVIYPCVRIILHLRQKLYGTTAPCWNLSCTAAAQSVQVVLSCPCPPLQVREGSRPTSREGYCLLFCTHGFDDGDWLLEYLRFWPRSSFRPAMFSQYWALKEHWFMKKTSSRNGNNGILRLHHFSSHWKCLPLDASSSLKPTLIVISAIGKGIVTINFSQYRISSRVVFREIFACGNAAATQPAAAALPQRELDFCRRRTFQPCLCHCQHHHFSLQLRQLCNSQAHPSFHSAELFNQEACLLHWSRSWSSKIWVNISR